MESRIVEITLRFFSDQPFTSPEVKDLAKRSSHFVDRMAKNIGHPTAPITYEVEVKQVEYLKQPSKGE